MSSRGSLVKNRLALSLFALMMCTILLTQIIPMAEAKGSEARKKAEKREKDLQDAATTKKKAKLNDEKKTIDAKATPATIKPPKGKAETDAKNAAKQQAMNNAKAAVEAARTAMLQARSDYRNDPASAVKKQAYEDAIKTYEKAKIDRELAKLS